MRNVAIGAAPPCSRYDRAGIEKWFQKCAARGEASPTSPSTGQPLESTALVPNVLARKAIDSFRETKRTAAAAAAGAGAGAGDSAAGPAGTGVS